MCGLLGRGGVEVVRADVGDHGVGQEVLDGDALREHAPDARGADVVRDVGRHDVDILLRGTRHEQPERSPLGSAHPKAKHDRSIEHRHLVSGEEAAGVDRLVRVGSLAFDADHAVRAEDHLQLMMMKSTRSTPALRSMEEMG